MPPSEPISAAQRVLIEKMFAALREDDVPAAEAVLAKGLDVPHARNSNSDTVLTVWYKLSSDMVRLLIDAGADVNARNRHNDFPLIRGNMVKNVESVRLLIKAGARVNDTGNVTGTTPLIEAVKVGCLDSVRALVEEGDADLELADKNGNTPLLQAVRDGKMGIVRFLIEKGADITAENKNGQGILHSALAYDRNPEVLAYLLECKAPGLDKKNISGYTPLMLASTLSSPDKLRMLINAGAKLDERREETGDTALIMATRGSHTKCVHALLEAGADPDIRGTGGNTALLLALSKARENIARDLLSHDCDAHLVNDEGETALHCACKNGGAESSPEDGGKINIVDLVLETGVGVNIPDKAGNMPIHVAARRASSKVVARLLEKGARPDALNNDGDPPLIMAARSVSEAPSMCVFGGGTLDCAKSFFPYAMDVARALVKAGVDPDAAGKDGQTAQQMIEKRCCADEAAAAFDKMRRGYRECLELLHNQEQHNLAVDRQKKIRQNARHKFRL